MTAQLTSAPTSAELDAARLLLARMGITPTDLLQAAPSRPQAPTFAEYIPIVSAAVGAGTRRVYGSDWNRILDQWGQRRLDEPTPSDVERLAEHVQDRQRSRPGQPAAATAHRDRLPPGRGPRAAARGPGPGPVPDPATREGRHRALAARLPDPDGPPATARPRPARPTYRTVAALPRRGAAHLPALRPSVAAHRRAPAVCGCPADQYPLAAPHRPTSAPPTRRSPPPWRPSPANHTHSPDSGPIVVSP